MTMHNQSTSPQSKSLSVSESKHRHTTAKTIKYQIIHTENKKSELMLMRRVRAYSSFCLQVILVYFHPLRRNSLFGSQKLPKITKTPIVRVQVIKDHQC